MSNDDLIQYGVPLVLLVCGLVAFYFMEVGKKIKLRERIARVTHRKPIGMNRSDGGLSLRRKTQGGLPLIGKLLASLPSTATLQARIERAGLSYSADIYIAVCGAGCVIVIGTVLALGKSPMLGVLTGLVLCVVLPYMVLGMKGAKRVKKFLTLFPDAIDFIVRGLRSGLPVTESMNMVGKEMAEPVGGIFAHIGESVRLGVSLEKALQDTAIKLQSTEFNFFVTSIILQRETGGNLSEILNNLSDVLRKRFMMKMKIKAMSSEAKASTLIVGSLPFIVTIALSVVAPNYIDLLINDPRGNIALGAAVTSLTIGIGTMLKMGSFEI